MNYTMLKGKIHRAVVKQADLNYVGSITVDTKLLEAAGILEYEMVQIVDVEKRKQIRDLHHSPESRVRMHMLKRRSRPDSWQSVTM